jgi:ADP-heptose:LPS heptosyltransferase
MGLIFRLRHLAGIARRRVRRQWRRAANRRAARRIALARSRAERHPPPLREAREIAVIRPDEIGDIVLASAFLRELRRSAPRARITLVVKRSVRPLVAACPYVDRVAVFDHERASDSAHPEPDLQWLGREVAARTFGGTSFDYVLLPRRCPDWCEATFLAWCLDSSCVAGSEDALSDLYPQRHHRAHLLDRCFRDDRVIHETAHGLEFLRWLGGDVRNDTLEVWLDEATRQRAREFLRRRFDLARPIVALHPSGGRSPLKQWPVARFQALARTIASSGAAQVIVVGGPDEAEWIKAAFSDASLPGLCAVPGELPLAELAAALGEVRLFVGGDSGPAHLAAAQGTPTLALFGATSETRFSPRGPAARVLSARVDCSPDQRGIFIDRCQTCLHDRLRCMEALTLEPVLAAVQTALRSAAPARMHAPVGAPEILPLVSP